MSPEFAIEFARRIDDAERALVYRGWLNPPAMVAAAEDHNLTYESFTDPQTRALFRFLIGCAELGIRPTAKLAAEWCERDGYPLVSPVGLLDDLLQNIDSTNDLDESAYDVFIQTNFRRALHEVVRRANALTDEFEVIVRKKPETKIRKSFTFVPKRLRKGGRRNATAV